MASFATKPAARLIHQIPQSSRSISAFTRTSLQRQSFSAMSTWKQTKLPTHTRSFAVSTRGCASRTSNAPKSRDRGPASEEDTQTDFAAMNILGNTPAPTTAIDACASDGFALNNGMKIIEAGVLLVGGEAFKWKPWIREGRKEGTIGAGAVGDDDKGVMSRGGKLLNAKGQFDVTDECWGLLELVWPKPDLLILGTGPSIAPVSPATRKRISDLGIRLEIQDTRNAASQFNLLATERGIQQVAAALIPIGWREGQ